MFKNLFSYESPLFQFLLKVSNWVFLNLLFWVCSLPIVTLGAAQAGLMNAVRVLQDPEDDSSCYKAFFRGFFQGLGKITLINSVCLVLIVTMLYVLFSTIYFDAIWQNAPVIPAILGLAIGILMQSMTSAFHSRFDCSIWQIIRSSWYMILMHPVRAAGMAVIVWLPIIVALLDLYLFLQVTPLWMFVYFTLAYQVSVKIMKSPFREIEDQFVVETDEEEAILDKEIEAENT